MSKLIDYYGNQIWYDLSSNEDNDNDEIDVFVKNIDGSKFYVRLHREDGPAYISFDGTQQYAIKGKLHREDGPAVIWSWGEVVWGTNGYRCSFEDWCKELNKSPEEINFLKLKYHEIG